MNMRLRGVIIDSIGGAAIWLLIGLAGKAAFGGTVNVEWEPPTDPDLAGVRVYYAPAVVTYTEAAGILTWQTVAVVGPTNSVWAAAPTNRATITATTGPYALWAVACYPYGAESDPCSNLYTRIGKATTIKLRKVTP